MANEVPVETFNWLRDKFHTKGHNSLLLEWRILKTSKGYSRLTVRQLYYILCSRFRYPATRNFYKRLNYHLTKMRRLDPKLNLKFIDPTRPFAIPPLPYHKIEIWCEKYSIRTFITKLAVKYRLGIQVLRGFASLSMYRRALARARKRGVTLILYIGDFDPSGLLIEKVAQEEMNHKLAIKFVRLAITLEQAKHYIVPSRPINWRDSRAKEYAKKYGDRTYEFEALRPRTALKLIEEGLKANVPPEFLVETEARERAAKIARPVTEKLRRAIEREVLRLLELGIPEGEILARVSEKYGVKLKRRS